MEDPGQSIPGLPNPLTTCVVVVEPEVPNVIGMTEEDANDAIIVDFTLGSVTYAWNAATLGNVYAQDPAGGSTPGGGSPVDINVSRGPQPTNCIPAGSNYDLQRADFNTYVTNLWDPTSWCAAYHCDGDADSASQGWQGYQVFTNDLTALSLTWEETAGTYPAGADPRGDMDHNSQGWQGYRVFTNDLTILSNHWQDTAGDLVGDCPRPDPTRFDGATN
jgi:hypothetical protein